LRDARLPVALLPDQWASARAGGVVAVGARGGAWAPLPKLCGAVVVDAHAEAYHEERAPTWSSWGVVAERARRDGASCVLISPCPTLELLEAGSLVVAPPAEERRGWPRVEVVDRRGDDPRTGLYSHRVVELARWAAAEEGRRVVCVLNRKGRAKLVSCADCGALACCERCGSATALERDDKGDRLECRRCGVTRPPLCASCGGTRLKMLRVGVSRVREELEALVQYPVLEISGPGEVEGLAEARVIAGTEAALHRVGRADAVVFLDIDAELLAPRMAAAEQAMALLARAARIVGARAAGARGRAAGQIMVQTRMPDHHVIAAVTAADPGIVVEAERPVRVELGLPPFSAMALISGPSAESFVHSLEANLAPGTVLRGPVEEAWTLRAPNHAALADSLAAAERPGTGLRVEVDPVRA
ncbi:MAG: hypothetical protein ACYDD4_10305, partial [Acidimicrobiales bacterium]